MDVKANVAVTANFAIDTFTLFSIFESNEFSGALLEESSEEPPEEPPLPQLAIMAAVIIIVSKSVVLKCFIRLLGLFFERNQGSFFI
jgi:hypothetical protein